MRASDFIYEARRLFELKKMGRAFNHLEDLVFFYGTKGVQEALEHLRELATQQGAESIRMKWDGAPQVYWGRERKGGPLILTGHNGWLRGAKTDSPEALEDFIANKSGKPGTDEEKAKRNAFAKQFASWYPALDKATPQDCVGFVYADGLFFERPKLDDNGVYNFCPNPKSETCYHVRAESELGKKISQADIMVVGHAFFPEFGLPDAAQEPISDFSMFNSNPEVIVLGPVYNTKGVSVDTAVLDKAEQYAKQHGGRIDAFLEGMAGLSDLKEILYRYVNQTAKAKQLDQLGSSHFYNWLKGSKVSANKQAKIAELDQANGNVIDEIFTLVKDIQAAKNSIIDQLEGERGEIWDTNGEGHVRYADAGKELGNVKFVTRHRWTPGG
jgi:hypothetical protein